MKKKLIKVGLIVIIIAVLIIGGMFLQNQMNGPKITSGYVNGVLRGLDELGVAELEYQGFHLYEDKGGIPFFNQGNFLMTYTAVAKYGINLEDVTAKVNDENKVVIIEVPKAKILDVDVEKSDYYSEKFAPFNFDDKKDADKAHAQVEKEAQTNSAVLSALSYANARSKSLMVNLLSKTLPDGWKVEVKTKS